MFSISYDRKRGLLFNNSQESILIEDRFTHYTEEMYIEEGIDFIVPMSAYEVKNKDIPSLFEDLDYIIEEKIDGVRSICHIHEGVARLFSRNIVKSSNWLGEYTDHLPQIHYPTYNQDMIIDGELYLPDFDCSTLAGTLNTLPEEGRRRQYFEVGFINYRVFDILSYKGEDLREYPLIERKKILRKALKELNNPYIQEVEYFDDKILIDNKEYSKKEYYEYLISQEKEGIMFKHKQGTYSSKRGRAYQKLKSIIHRDVVITGYNPPEKEYTGKFANDPSKWRYWEDLETHELFDTSEIDPKTISLNEVVPVTKHYYNCFIGTVEVSVMLEEGDKEFLSKHRKSKEFEFRELKGKTLVVVGNLSGMDEDVRELLSLHQEVGQVIEVEANSLFDTGKMRHPRFIRFRNDKEIEDCTFKVHMNIGG